MRFPSFLYPGPRRCQTSSLRLILLQMKAFSSLSEKVKKRWGERGREESNQTVTNVVAERAKEATEWARGRARSTARTGRGAAFLDTGAAGRGRR